MIIFIITLKRILLLHAVVFGKFSFQINTKWGLMNSLSLEIFLVGNHARRFIKEGWSSQC